MSFHKVVTIIFSRISKLLASEKAFIYLLLEKIIKLFSNLVVVGLIAKAIGPDSFGIYSLAITFFVIGQTIALAGIDNLFIREYVKGRWRNQLVQVSLKTRFWFSIVGALISAMLATLVIQPDLLSKNWTSIAFILLPVLFVLFEVADLINQANYSAYISAQVRMLATIASGALRITAVYFDSGLIVFSLIFLFEYALTGIVYYVRVLRADFFNLISSGRPAQLDRVVFWKASEQTMLLFVALINILYNRIDQIVINHFIGSFANGIYAPAVALVSSTYVLASSVALTRFPKFCATALVDINQAVRDIKNLAWKFFAIGLIVYACLTAIAPLFIENIYGGQYFESVGVVQILASGIPFTFFGIIYNSTFLVLNRQLMLVAKTMIGLMASIAIFPFSAAQFGISGVAWSYVFVIFLTEFTFALMASRVVFNAR
jgi:O-antigen/teichoic acid export membrane protein